MTPFEELRELYTSWDKAHLDYRDAADTLVRTFHNEFRRFLAAPASYKRLGEDEQQPYMSLRRAVQGEDGEIYLKEGRHPFDFLFVNTEGQFVTAITLTLDRGAGHFPKTTVWWPLRYAIVDDVWELTVGKGANSATFKVDPGTPSTFEPAYRFMVEMLQQTLSRKPWERQENSAIGFGLLHPKDAASEQA